MKCSKDVSFSLIFNDKRPPLDLVTCDTTTKEKWVKVLSTLLEVLNDPIGNLGNAYNGLPLYTQFEFIRNTFIRNTCPNFRKLRNADLSNFGG